MADIELVIKIPEELYKQICEIASQHEDCSLEWEAIMNGTPLPKGHDRLIEANEDLYQEIRKWAGGDVASHIIANAQVIVEAYKESN